MLSLLVLCFGLVGVDDGAASIPKDSAERAAYEAAQAKAGHDAKAHVRLALWCESHGLDAERMKHLAMAVLYDPSNGLARGLLGLVTYQGKWARPDEVSRQVQDDPERKALMQEYFQRRAKTTEKAEDQWKLAVWCEQNGLKDQAIAQYHAVLRRDPTREAVWKRLGFKKLGGRWIKPEWQAAHKHESEQQNRANKHWKPSLEKWRDALFGRDKTRRNAAEEALLGVTDPRAVPMIWTVFVPKGAEGQKAAVRVLGQVDAPGASRSLAILALMSASAEARQGAAQTLRQRDARDFAPFLIGLIRDPIRYEVKPVRGPGQRGELVIKDGTTNRKRLYTPLAEPDATVLPNDQVTIDPATGLPVVSRIIGTYMPEGQRGLTLSQMQAAMGITAPAGAGPIAGMLNKAGLPAAQSQRLGQAISANAVSSYQFSSSELNMLLNANPSFSGTYGFAQNEILRIPVGQMELDAQRSARVASQQLSGDVQAIDAYNAPILETNRRVRQVLSEAVGIDKGDDHSAWLKWLVDLFGYAYVAQKASTEETTVIEQVPLAYQPQAMPVVQQSLTIQPGVAQHSCFGAGTTVRTLDGPRLIEDLRAGDEVLTQNPKTGELRYQPLVEVYHNPPNATFRIELEVESIVATGIHRLWKAGKGWTMARDLKPGDILRTLGGTAAVKSVVEEKVQPVFNLQVADGESFFVGRSGVLAHDNSTINPTPEPFDAVLQVGDSTKANPTPGR